MRVICINTGILRPPATNKYVHLIKEGEVYTVEMIYWSGTGYLLKEIKEFNGCRPGFRVERFVPLSNIDETEMYREPATEKTPTP